MLAIPFAVLTTNSIVSRWGVRAHICDIPEDNTDRTIPFADEPAIIADPE